MPVAPIGWPFASSPPDVLTGMRPVSDVSPSSEATPPLPFSHEAEVLDVEDLGDREAVVHLGHVDVGRADAGHRVRALRRVDRGLQPDEARLLVQVRVVGGDAEAGDEHRAGR